MIRSKKDGIENMVNVAILGFGVVGSGVAEVLTGNGAGISKKAD